MHRERDRPQLDKLPRPGFIAMDSVEVPNDSERITPPNQQVNLTKARLPAQSLCDLFALRSGRHTL